MKLYIKSIKAHNNALCLWIVFNIFLCFDFLKWALLSPKPSSRHQWGFCFRRCQASKVCNWISRKQGRRRQGVNGGALFCFLGVAVHGWRRALSRAEDGVWTGLPSCPLRSRLGRALTPRAPGLQVWPGENRDLAFSRCPDKHHLWGQGWGLQASLEKVGGPLDLSLGKVAVLVGGVMQVTQKPP